MTREHPLLMAEFFHSPIDELPSRRSSPSNSLAGGQYRTSRTTFATGHRHYLVGRKCLRAASALRTEGIAAVVAPNLPYGVTDFAEGFAGAISIPEDTLIAFIVAGCGQFLGDGFKHVCLINHHLEPGQLSALQQAHDQVAERYGVGTVSFPKRWSVEDGDVL